MNLKHSPIPLAIIGGGAAGLFAAVTAADRGLGTLVFERKARVGSKLLMTANGRCNFTKDISADQMIRDLGDPVGPWAAPALRACPPALIARGFRACGVRIRRMEDGRLFPDDGKAATIVHAFGDALRDQSVPLTVNCPVTGVQPVKNGFIVATANFTVWAENVLIATGGISFPKTGSVGDGQNFARLTGHRLTPYRAGLVGFETRDPVVTRRAGARYEQSFARVLDANGRPAFSATGEVDCETWGVGGAAVYHCSRWLARHPLPGKWILEAGIERETVRLPAPIPRSVKEAIVTIGGVALDDVDPLTMMSRKVPGLYFAGEVLDIDGPTGGYNLTLAFATARSAVTAVCAGRRLKA